MDISRYQGNSAVHNRQLSIAARCDKVFVKMAGSQCPGISLCYLFLNFADLRSNYEVEETIQMNLLLCMKLPLISYLGLLASSFPK
jgi:hypothetical protein